MDSDTGFVLQVDQGARGPVVRLAGDLDLSSAPQLRKWLHNLAGQIVTLDFAGVTFMDSTCIGVLVAAWKRAQDDGGEIRLHAVAPLQMRLFDLTGITEILTFDGDGYS